MKPRGVARALWAVTAPGVLTDDLRRPRYRGRADPLAGHCYVATEVLWHLLGGNAAGWRRMFVRHEGEPHWFLRHEGGTVVDATASQFRWPVPYERGVGKGFPKTGPRPDAPSRRGAIALARARRALRG